MPYKSDSQRRWAHTQSGLKALGGPEGVNEWDQASKGKKLPEKAPKMAEGGIIDPTTEPVTQQPDEFNKAIQSGMNGDLDTMLGWKDQLMEYLKSQFGKADPTFGSTLGTDTTGFQGLANKKAGIQPQGYAMGGMPGQDDMFMQQLQAGTTGVSDEPTFNPNAGMPPQTPMQQPQSPVLAPKPMPMASMPYIQGQKAQLNKYGPEEQLALEQNLLKQRRSLPQTGAVAAGTLADALMQGVARAGSGGFADRIQNTQNEQAKEQMGALEKAGTQNIARTEATEKLDAMDPSSPLSKIAQQTWGPLLARNGFKPAQIAGMPASAIASLTGQTVEALKAEAEAKMAAATLGLKQQEHTTNVEHQKVEEGLGRTNEIMKAGEELRAHPIQRMLGILPGQKGLQEMVAGAESPAIPEGRVTVVSPTGVIGHVPKEQLDSAINAGYKVQ